MIHGKRHWVFDLDGTLVDSFQYYLNILERVFAGYGVSLTEEDIKLCFGQPADKFLASKLSPSEVRAALTVLRDQSVADSREIEAFAGIKDLLLHLQQSGKKIAVWTSRDGASADMVLKNTGLGQYIDFCVTGTCVTQHKPDPEGLHMIATKFSCELSDLIVVGDHDFDVKAAKSTGAYAVRASWHRFDPPLTCTYADELFMNVVGLLERTQRPSVLFQQPFAVAQQLL